MVKCSLGALTLFCYLSHIFKNGYFNFINYEFIDGVLVPEEGFHLVDMSVTVVT